MPNNDQGNQMPGMSPRRPSNPPPAYQAPPAAAPPPGYEVQYDLAGNPMPPQQAPLQDSRYGAPPSVMPSGPYGQPQQGYRAPGAYPRPAESRRPQPSIPAGMEEAVNTGASWILGVATLTIVTLWLTCLTYPITVPYISYAGLSTVILTTLGMGAVMKYPVAAALGTAALLPIVGLGLLGYKRYSWVFMVGMIIYGLDIPMTILFWVLNFSFWGLIVGTAWHGWVFSRIFSAWTATREIARSHENPPRY